MAKRLVYFNGEFVPEPEARISIFDCALMYGDMVFEMTRSFGATALSAARASGAALRLAQVRADRLRDGH